MACTAGAGGLVLDSRAVRVRAGDVMRLPADAAHAYWCVEAPWRLTWAVYVEDRSRPPCVPAPLALRRGDTAQLEHVVSALIAEAQGPRDRQALAQFASLVDRCARRLAGDAAADGALAPVWEAVVADLARPWRLGDLARLAGMGIETLRARCLAETARSPIAQVAYLRMQRAAALLAVPGATVAAVAEQVGYGNPFAFSTAFARAMGMAPSGYQGRRRVRIGP